MEGTKWSQGANNAFSRQVYDAFRSEGEWPVSDYIDRQIYRASKTDIAEVVQNISEVLLLPVGPRGVAGSNAVNHRGYCGVRGQ
jgi:hypothetical protein